MKNLNEKKKMLLEKIGENLYENLKKQLINGKSIVVVGDENSGKTNFLKILIEEVCNENKLGVITFENPLEIEFETKKPIVKVVEKNNVLINSLRNKNILFFPKLKSSSDFKVFQKEVPETVGKIASMFGHELNYITEMVNDNLPTVDYVVFVKDRKVENVFKTKISLNPLS